MDGLPVLDHGADGLGSGRVRQLFLFFQGFFGVIPVACADTDEDDPFF